MVSHVARSRLCTLHALGPLTVAVRARACSYVRVCVCACVLQVWLLASADAFVGSRSSFFGRASAEKLECNTATTPTACHALAHSHRSAPCVDCRRRGSSCSRVVGCWRTDCSIGYWLLMELNGCHLANALPCLSESECH